MIAAIILLAACLATMTVTAAIAASDWRRQVDARRVAEVALATASEGLIAARDAVQVAENLHRAERERADFLEEQLHDADVLLATGKPAGGGTSRERLQNALGAVKRVSNLAAGPDRSRHAGPAQPQPVFDPTPAATSARARGAGDGPTEPER